MTALTPLDVLRDPARSLPAFGEVLDQKTGQFLKYDPERLTGCMQLAMLNYFSDPPKTADGQTRFYTVLGSRQTGKSLTPEYCAYVKAAFIPGWDHACISDTKDRADYLHKRVHQLHARWRGPFGGPVSLHESRQLTFDQLVGGRMRVLSAESGAVGLGQSPDSFHASECFAWDDFGGSMTLIWPSLMNRDHALAVFEATPWEAQSDWHEHCLSAKTGQARHVYAFFPFWDGKLNWRPWTRDMRPDTEELRLMEKHRGAGLRPGNLAFRRLMLATDRQLRRRPELFEVWYPFDDVSCWLASANAAIPAHALARHQVATLVSWREPYVEYEPPSPGGVYVLGVDPCGHAARDHASFQVLRVFEGKWIQVACYAAHTDPLAFTREVERVAARYNKALVVVEANGVGQSVLALLRLSGYSPLYHEKHYSPGLTTTAKSLDEMLGWLVDALLDELVLHDAGTVEQLMSYKNDKRIEEAPSVELVRGEPSKRRRDRGHWDKVSALMMAVAGARRVRGERAWRKKRDAPAGTAPIHPGVYRFDEQTKKWKEMQRHARGVRRHVLPEWRVAR